MVSTMMHACNIGLDPTPWFRIRPQQYLWILSPATSRVSSFPLYAGVSLKPYGRRANCCIRDKLV